MKNSTSCFRNGVSCNCPICESNQIIKNGKTNLGKQRYCCKNCGKRFIQDYTYKAYLQNTNTQIILFIKEGLGIRSISRVLSISTTTLLKRIVVIANSIKKPPIAFGKTYEVDEMRTFVGNKGRLFWIVLALDRASKKVVDFSIGNRTNKTLGRVISNLKTAQAQKIYTDKLKNYEYLIPKNIHSTYRHATNHIERCNLTLRTHLRRLQRKTICFSRSQYILFGVLQIYLWG